MRVRTPGCNRSPAAPRDRLRDTIDVALYTPGNPLGRPLSIAIAPAGLGLLGSFEREQVARYAASALVGMRNYTQNRSDQSRLAVLAEAIELNAPLDGVDSVPLDGLIAYIAENDAGLVNAIGHLDTKLFDKPVQDLETLRSTKGEFLSSQGEPLDVEALFGLGQHARPGKTRLSIISTKFLGMEQDVQFWVSHTERGDQIRRWMYGAAQIDRTNSGPGRPLATRSPPRPLARRNPGRCATTSSGSAGNARGSPRGSTPARRAAAPAA
jgi:hypothetical protein